MRLLLYAMVYLPRSYLIKQLRSDMNILCHIQRTPGAAEGAEVDVEQELKCAIHSIIAENRNAKHFSVKGSFTIIDIYESVHSVRFLMTPSPLPKSVL